jgi:hypothetical protein
VADEPTPEEIANAYDKLAIGDLLRQTVFMLSQLTARRMLIEPTDLAQARLGIDALDALAPLLDVPGVTPNLLVQGRPYEPQSELKSMIANLKLTYAAAVAPTPESEPELDPDTEPEPDAAA